MKTRREFIKVTGAAALGSAFLSTASAFNLPMQHAVGLQLFTFFGAIDDDVEGTLKKIRAVGYTEIESAYSKKGGFYGMKPKEWNTFLKNLGLSWQSHHVLGAPFKLPPGAKMPMGADGKPIVIPVLKNLRENYKEIIDDAAEGGVPYLVCANTPFDTTEELKLSIDTLNKSAEVAKKAGIQLCYHNHDKEFEKLDGKVVYDRLLSETNADELKMELDLCWAVKAGVDPVELFKKSPGRYPLWHVKDLDKERQGPAPVGEGVVNFKPIFESAKIAGMKHFFVEHDAPKDAYASITTSYQNIEKLLKTV